MQQFPAVVTLAMILSFAWTSVSAAADPSMRTRPHASDLGIWKLYSPKNLHGELDNYDPIGLIAGALIHTDCSIIWTDPDNGKTYCFSSGTSLVYFENWPKTYSRKAAEALEKMKEETPSQ